jgi:hypothetical protein
MSIVTPNQRNVIPLFCLKRIPIRLVIMITLKAACITNIVLTGKLGVNEFKKESEVKKSLPKKVL